MRRRPLFALGMLVLAAALGGLQLHMEQVELVVLSWSSAAVMTTAWFTGQPSLVRAFAALVIASITLVRMDWAPPRAPIDPIMGRCEGRVTTVRPTDSGGWFCVEGEMDLAPTPACSCTTIIRVYDQQNLPPLGCTVVVTGPTAPPRSDPGWPTIEMAWCRSQAASFLMTARTLAVTGPPSGRTVCLQHLRSLLAQEIDERLPQQSASVMKAMILGDRTALDPGLKEASATTGTTHLFAVSGLHVGTVLGLVLFVVGGSVRRWIHWFLAVAAVALFVAVTGGEAPAIRALIMAAAAGYGRMQQKDVDLLNLLGLTIVLELLFLPELLLRPSFLLSTAVTAGLLWWVPPLVKTLRRFSSRRWWQLASPMIGVPFVAAGASALPGAALFGSISLISPLINLVVVPMMMLALTATVCVLLVGWVSPSLAEILAWSPTVIIEVVDRLIRAASHDSPLVPSHVLPLTALTVTGTVLWLRRSTRARELVVRLVIAMAIISLLLDVPATHSDGIACRRIRDQIEVRVTRARNIRTFSIGKRYGRPFVRSYHADHSSDSGP